MGVIGREEGIRRGIYNGIEASCLREGSYSTLRLGLYEPIKRMLNDEKTQPGHEPFHKKVLAGAMAGGIGSAFANPTDLLKTRAQAATPGSFQPLSWHIKDVYNNHGGLRGFYTGTTPTVLRAIAVGASYLGTYDTIKHGIINQGWMNEGRVCQFIASIFAGFFITVSSSPIDNIKSYMMN